MVIPVFYNLLRYIPQVNGCKSHLLLHINTLLNRFDHCVKQTAHLKLGRVGRVRFCVQQVRRCHPRSAKDFGTERARFVPSPALTSAPYGRIMHATIGLARRLHRHNDTIISIILVQMGSST